ncbi:GerA spore germination protein [Paenibacillus cellulosilyticus]|uniref:GerA spore germination protein n=1 Tax=Paenibacillus cellulosilyticus TaxID=375489 RepID=A0A2V2YV73_9BACL|nr:spore germination protein [Paenibacillus cellulosilyticus]PWW01260.1 GerA spore germination protein [Paenibacillus cellulosilyticus]QKS46793.1 spore germination protein [Paenibacillus cellulosilyticus]
MTSQTKKDNIPTADGQQPTTNERQKRSKESFVITEQSVRNYFDKCEDVIVDKQLVGEPSIPIVIAYCTGMCETKMINEVILPEIHRIHQMTEFKDHEAIDQEAALLWSIVDVDSSSFGRDILAIRVFEGHMLFCIPSLEAIWSIDISKLPARTPEESTTEVSIRGAKDGFVEHLAVNIALVRTRIRTADLACIHELVGSQSSTKVALMYMKSIANLDTIQEVLVTLRNLKTESIFTSNQLEEHLNPSRFTLFPITDYTGRPDFAAECLMAGRFILILDGNPSIIIAPVNLFLLLKSPEDSNFPFLSVNVGRILRIIGLITSIFLPGFYLALTSYHMDQLPYALVATISVGRMGLPMESAVEMFLIMGLMELFREAGVRLPSAIGQTLTVVGGLIIGESAIRAGMVSPLMIVVVATTVVAGATVVNQVMTSSIILIRFISFLFSAMFGIYGFIFSLILFIVYLSGLESFGVPYLAPISPLNIRQALAALFKLPRGMNKRRPASLYTQKPNREGQKT